MPAETPIDEDLIAVRKAVANAMHNKAYLLGNTNHPADALKTYQQLIEFARANPDAEDDYGVSLAMSNIAILQGECGDPQASLDTCNELIARFGDIADVSTTEQVARAYHDRAVALSELGRKEESLKSYSDLVDKFSSSSNSAIQLQVLQGMMGQAFRLEDQHDIEGAVGKLKEAFNQFHRSDDEGIRKGITRTLYNLARLEASSGRFADAGVYAKHLEILANELRDPTISARAERAAQFATPEASADLQVDEESPEREAPVPDNVTTEENP